MLSSNTSAVSGDTVYVEDVFSTYLYTGNASTQTITNNIDLSTKGGLVWIKDRTTAYDHQLYDTARGANNTIRSNLTNAQQTYTTALTSFNTDGFSLGSQATSNLSGDNLVSWTFRKQPKFFDVVTYTGDGTSTRNISHALGSTPGFIVVKRTDNISNWTVYHRSAGTNGSLPNYLQLNGTAAATAGDALVWPSAPTSTYFTVGSTSSLNASGGTYVAYIFAHDAGGFGLTGTDNVISCGSYAGNTSGNTLVNLGYEPQYLLIKRTDTTGNWFVMDNMRGIIADGTDTYLWANTAAAEAVSGSGLISLDPLGFRLGSSSSTQVNTSGGTFIYIAIRRGPMKVPTDGTKVFKPVARTGTSGNATVSGVGFPPDMCLTGTRTNSAYDTSFDRLRGLTKALFTPTTSAEDGSFTNSITSFTMDGMTLGPDTNGSFGDVVNGSGAGYVYWLMRRAPSFFDEVCYTGTGSSGLIVNHNLGVAPELVIFKGRNTAGTYWGVYASALPNQYLYLNLTNAAGSGFSYLSASSSTTMTLNADNDTNFSGRTQVAYLFATCPGVSKVGSYTGNGSSQTINCGFAGGARFVLIKRTDSTGDWYVWDTARGIVSGNDGHLSLNTTAAEVTTDDTIDTDSTGFIVNQLAATNVNVNAATYIFLAIA